MTKEYCFRIADFQLSVRMPDNMNVDRLLPSFRAFRCESPQEGERLFECDVLPVGDALPVILSEELLETAENENGILYKNAVDYLKGLPGTAMTEEVGRDIDEEEGHDWKHRM